LINLKEFVKGLSKDEKDNLIKILKTDIMDESNRFKNGGICPVCKSNHIIKNGNHKTNQRYICKNCRNHFTIYNDTILEHTHKNVDEWKHYIDLMFDGLTISRCAEKLDICIQTSFRWRHKILKMLEQKFTNDKLSGIVEIDETFVRESKKNIVYKHRRKLRGLSHQQVGVLVAIDRDNNIVSKVYGKGKMSESQLNKILKGKISKKSVMITDGYSVYKKFAIRENIELKQCKAGKSISKKYHINHVNSYHSYLKDFLKKFRGISTKYLDEYLTWFKFIKQKNDVGYLFNDLILG
jgi:transposase-like protein/IS1 family transposase